MRKGSGVDMRKGRGPVAPPLRGFRSAVGYRYWPVLVTVSMARPDSVPLPPETSVRM
jgi:hypothetical protein